MIFNPENEHLHYHAVKWFLRAKSFDSAVKSLRFLNENHPKWHKTVYANARFRSFFSTEANKALLKGKTAENVNQLIENIFGEQDASTYFEAKSKNEEAGFLAHQRYFVKGASRLFGEAITKTHLQNVFDILEQAGKDPAAKVRILKDLQHVVKLVEYSPDDLKQQLVDLADQVYYKFKSNLAPASSTE